MYILSVILEKIDCHDVQILNLRIFIIVFFFSHCSTKCMFRHKDCFLRELETEIFRRPLLRSNLSISDCLFCNTWS